MARYRRPNNQSYPKVESGLHVAELKDEDFLPVENSNEEVEEEFSSKESPWEQENQEEVSADELYEPAVALVKEEEVPVKTEEAEGVKKEETEQVGEALECNQMDENPEDFRSRVSMRRQMQQRENLSPESEMDEIREERVFDSRDLERPHSTQRPVTQRPPVTERPVTERRVVNHAMVRILNAAAGYEPLFVIVGNKTIATALSFGKLSQYEQVPDGFRTVIVYSSLVPRTPLLTTVLPFIAGQRLTLAILNTARGMQVVPMFDTTCSQQMNDISCFRVANLTFDDGPFDISLSDGTVVFNDVNVKEVTTWKQAIAGDYEFYVSITPVGSNLPEQRGNIPLNQNVPQGNQEETQYLFSFYQTIVPDTTYTACIVGGYYTEVPLQVIIIEN